MSIRVRVRRKPDRQTLQLWYKCPMTGKQITRSADTDNFRAAERAASDWERELADHTTVDNPSWDAFRIRFEDEYLIGKPRNTQISYRSALNNWEKHVGSVRAMSLITPSVVSKFSADFGKTVVSIATVASNLRHIRAALRWAESMEMIRRAPRIVMPKSNRRRLARSRAITQEEFDQMRAVAPKIRPATEAEHWQRLLDLLWLSGLRIGEALELSWNEPPIRVDLDGGRYPRLVIWGEGQKSRQDEQAVIAPDFAAWLRETPDLEREGLVVDLGEFDRTVASHVIADCGKLAGIKTSPSKFASAHDIRRAFGQRWAKVVRPMTLQKMMRHSSLQTTLDYYVDLEDEDVGRELWGPASVPPTVPQEERLPSEHKLGACKSPEKNKKESRR